MLMTILYFVLGLGLLIFIHELGHFLVAKWNGIRVERFSLGFGPRLIKFQWGETEYCISALPLGGYVKMTGQEDFGEEEIVPLDDPKAFSSKSLWRRLSVVFAGPAMNLILPFILMPVVFMLGRTEPRFLGEEPQVVRVMENSEAEWAEILVGDRILSVNGRKVSTWNEVLRETSKPAGSLVQLELGRSGQTLEKEIRLAEREKGSAGMMGIEPMFFFDMKPIIGEFAPGSPAKEAGFQSGDLVVSINDKPIGDWQRMSEEVNASGGKELKFSVARDGKPLDIAVSPVFNEEHKKYVIGVTKASDPDLYQKHRYPFGEAVVKGFEENITLFGMTFKVLKDLVTLKASYKELGGPIRIAQISAKAAEQGTGNFLFLLAFLSIQLGVLNLLPIPVLDGGHVMFMVYEGVRGRPLSVKKRLIAQQVGMFLLLTLMVLVTVNDIDAVWGFKDILTKIKGLFG
jgi:regulator of sigma E protease